MWVDWKDIPISSEWLADIFNGIENADNFLFFVTPESLASQVCHIELAHARACGKAIIPVIVTEAEVDVALATFASQPIDPIVFELIKSANVMQIASENYLAIKRFNWLYMTDRSKFDEQIKLLLNTIRQDLLYKSLHTRFLIRANLWHEKKHIEGYLLSRTEIREALIWLDQSKIKIVDEQPTELQYEYIMQSQRFLWKQRRQSILALASTLLIALIVGIGSVFAFDLLPDPLPYLGKAVNIGIADFTITSGANDERGVNRNGIALAQILGSVLDARLPDNLRYLIEIEAGNLGVIQGDSTGEQRDNARELANKINAHILIYGTIDITRNPAQYRLSYYLGEGLADAEELTGVNSFGLPVEIELPIIFDDPGISDGNNTIALYTDPSFINQVDILSNFVIGLALLKEEEPDAALPWFQLAYEAGGAWENEDTGAAIILYWTGVATLLSQDDLICPLPVALNPFDADPSKIEYLSNAMKAPAFLCAQAYYLEALRRNPDYVRAQMGIANAYQSAAESTFAGRRVIRCDLYLNAIDLYKNALVMISLSDAFDNINLIRMKIYYNIGLAYTNIRYAPSCDLESSEVDDAINALNRAIELYPDVIQHNSEAQKIVAQANYQLGLIHAIEGNFDEAFDAFNEVIDKVGDPDFYDEWHILEFTARLQMGILRLASTDDTQITMAITEFTRVIDAYPDLHTDDAILAETLLNRARAYELLGQSDDAEADYCNVFELEVSSRMQSQIRNSIDVEVCDQGDSNE